MTRPILSSSLPSGLLTLADVARHIADSNSIEEPRRTVMLAAIRRLAAWIGREPDRLVADMRFLGRMIDRIDRAANGITDKTIRNARSDVIAAISECRGLGRVRFRHYRLSPPWKQVVDLLASGEAVGIGRLLSNLINFWDEQGVLPENVDDHAFERWVEFYLARSTAANPKRIVREVRAGWNRCVRSIHGWPGASLTKPQRHPLMIKLVDMSPELQADIAEYRTYLNEPRRYRRKLRSQGSTRRLRRMRRLLSPNTVERHVNTLRVSLSHQVAAGTDLNSLTSISQLVDPHAIDKLVLPAMERRLRESNRVATPLDPDRDLDDGQKSYLYISLVTLETIARNWCWSEHDWSRNDSDDDQDSWPALYRDLREEYEVDRPDGLTEENRRRLQQFATRDNRLRLQMLPTYLFDRVREMQKVRTAAGNPPVSIKMVTYMQAAIVVALMWKIPVRRRNILQLSTDRIARLNDRRGRPYGQICWSTYETKNRRDLVVEVDGPFLELVDWYLEHCLPLIANGRQTGLLFPKISDPSTCYNPSGFTTKITHVIWKTIKVRIHFHLFRHLIAYIILNDDPSLLPMVSEILGHRNTETARRNYIDNVTLFATRHFDGIVKRGEREYLAEIGGNLDRLFRDAA